jgi:hypothetical protein
MDVQNYSNDGSYHYWDKLIGPNDVPILRGADSSINRRAGYCWTAKPEGRNVAIRVWKAGRESAVPLDKVPDYVMAHIMRAIAISD